MALIEGGEIGFDEGGVLQAMFSKPFYVNTVVERSYNRKGLLTRESTHTYNISIGDVVVAGIIAGVITLSIFSSAAIAAAADKLPSLSSLPSIPGKPSAQADYLRRMFGIIGGFLKHII